MSIALRSSAGVWGSRTTFLLALAAAAIGLGNIWRFSYLLGEHGGAPFLLVYIVCLFLVAVPVMIAEIVIGSHGRASPVTALIRASERSESAQRSGASARSGRRRQRAGAAALRAPSRCGARAPTTSRR